MRRCSSGIGRGVARVLAAKGFVVFATVRKEEDARSLSEEFNQKKLSGSRGALVPIWPVDLTSTESIDAMAENVKAKLLEYPGVKLYGIIHNAGGSWLGPSEFLPGEIMRRELEVRIMGPMRINKLLMSELRQSEGRILWMVAAGMMTLPFITAIHASLFAVDCLSMTYDIELQPWGIRSIRIGCGTIETGASDKVYNDLRNLVESNSAVKTLYGGVMDKLLRTLRHNKEFYNFCVGPAARTAYKAYENIELRRKLSEAEEGIAESGKHSSLSPPAVEAVMQRQVPVESRPLLGETLSTGSNAPTAMITSSAMETTVETAHRAATTDRKIAIWDLMLGIIFGTLTPVGLIYAIICGTQQGRFQQQQPFQEHMSDVMQEILQLLQEIYRQQQLNL
ncbi:short-chain dehydrogenase [Pelomyxa schiedti]|nr:short-chain dehydrogenase [Pelomyxa schiedti]